MPTFDPHAGHAPTDDEMPKRHDGPAVGPTAVDPVCGMTVSLKPDTRTETFGGKDFHFCSEKCQTRFKACLLYTSPSPRDGATSRMPSSA